MGPADVANSDELWERYRVWLSFCGIRWNGHEQPRAWGPVRPASGLDDLITEERTLVAAATWQHRQPDEDLDPQLDTALWLESGRPPSVSVTRIKRHLGAWQNKDLAAWLMTQLMQVAP